MRKIFVLSLFTAGFYLQAQSIGNSPYAAFGLGDVKYDNTVELNSMGGLGTAYVSDFSNSFNFANPAANKNLDLTTVRVEATNENNFFRSDYNSYKGTKSSTYLSNITLAFPITTKTKVGIGFQPYSSKKYDVLNASTDAAGVTTSNIYHGEGSLNTLHAALSYQVSPEIGLGVRANYYFGNLFDIHEVTTNQVNLVNGYETRYSIKNMNFTLGGAYQKLYDDDSKLTFGATTTFGNTSDLTAIYTNSTYFYGIGNVKEYETIIERKEQNGKNLLPFTASVGAGYGKNLKWFAGGQVDYKKGSTTDFLGTPFQYNDSFKVSAGGWYLPNANNFRNYFERVVYRYGAYFEKGNLMLNDKNVNKYALTFGVLLPFKNSGTINMSGLDLGFEVGKRGSLQNNLVNQTFVNFRLGLNFSDRWFKKLLYD